MQNEISPAAAALAAMDTGSDAALRTATLAGARQCVDANGIAATTVKARGPGLYRVILDSLLAPNGDGLKILCEIRNRDPQARISVVIADGLILRDPGEIRERAFNFLVKRFDQRRPLPPSDAAAKAHDEGSAVASAMRPVGYRIPEGGGRADIICGDTRLMPGFSAPKQDPGPRAPGPRDHSNGDDRLAAAIDALVGMSLAEVERLIIEATIQACGESLPKAARVLGVSPSTLYRKRAGWIDQSGDR